MSDNNSINFTLEDQPAAPVPEFKRQVLSDMVYDYILDGIVNGTFKVGDKINVDSLSRTLGVSRTPVRESLRSLEQIGLVVSIPYYGMQVNKLSVEEIKEIYDIRLLMEPYVLRRTIACITDTEITELEQLEGEIEALLDASRKNIRQVFQLNQDFHMNMFQYSHLDKFYTILKQLWYNLAFFRLLLANQDSYPSQLKQEHQNYLQALKARDEKQIVELCEDTLRSHALQMPEIVEHYYSFLDANK